MMTIQEIASCCQTETHNNLRNFCIANSKTFAGAINSLVANGIEVFYMDYHKHLYRVTCAKPFDFPDSSICDCEDIIIRIKFNGEFTVVTADSLRIKQERELVNILRVL